MGRSITSGFTLFTMIVMAFVMSQPRPASACSCDSGLPVDLLQNSDLAFIGSLIDQQPDFAGTSTESLFAVEQIIKGELENSVIVAAATDSECGAGLPTESRIAIAAVKVPGEILPQVCTSMDAQQMLAAADELALDVRLPPAEELATALPQSTSNYAAAIPLSIALSLVFLGAVALGTRSSSMTPK